ncbi:MAG: EAL domain-containing protein [Deltaproteobacteria bacterium]|nr:EAL domain-containing protein [Deltaproteobacteria bacterium]
MSGSPPTPQATSSGRVLLVDDEVEPLRATARLLRHAGFDVIEAASGEAAARAVANDPFDVVLSDIAMPGMDGIAFLQLVRKHDEDLPVVLVTGAPAVETAMDAVEHGAFKYLVKPVAPERLEDVVRSAVRMRRLASIRREAMQLHDGTDSDGELERNLDRALESLWIAYQPIVHPDGRLFGYEALLRSDERTMPTPGHMLAAAERLGKLSTLGRRVRARTAEPFTSDRGALFVNLHPRDLDDEELLSPGSPLARIASSVVLEVTERTSIDAIHDLRTTIARLRALGYRIAVDDLGAGYAGLTSFAMLEPEIVKIDMSLVRDVDKNPVKQRLIASFTSLCKEMGILVVAEGVETLAEREMLVGLGCNLFQGYLIAKPGRPFPTPCW